MKKKVNSLENWRNWILTMHTDQKTLAWHLMEKNILYTSINNTSKYKVQSKYNFNSFSKLKTLDRIRNRNIYNEEFSIEIGKWHEKG